MVAAESNPLHPPPPKNPHPIDDRDEEGAALTFLIDDLAELEARVLLLAILRK